MKRTVIFAAVLAAAAPAHAGTYYNGNDLYEECSKDSGGGWAICLGHILGVYDSLLSKPIDCAPNAVRAKQLRDVVVQSLQAHPEKRHLVASSLVFYAIKDAFCPRADIVPPWEK